MESLTLDELRRCIRDLFGLAMLPALWRQADERHICESLADAIVRTLNAELVYVLVPHSNSSKTHSSVRAAADRDYDPSAIADLFAPILRDGHTTSRVDILGTEMSVFQHPIELRDRPGVVVAARCGSRFPTEVERALLGVAANQAAVALENARYVSEREQLVSELAAASRRKDEFLAVLGHELRNPLAAIQAAHALLRQEGGHVRADEIITHQLATLMRLVDDLLDVSRVTTGKLPLQKGKVDLRDTIEKARAASEHAAVRKCHTVVIDVCAEPLWVDGDAVRLEQMIVNLAGNAVKYTPDGGHISIAASRTADGHAMVLVVDDGSGIAPELLPRIFEPFVQADSSLHRTDSGLGLGLALVKGVAELHGGTVTVTSDGPGKGCVVLVRLPLAEPADLTAPAAIAPSGDRTRTRLRVLLVDDNVDMTEMLAVMLEASGHHTASANDGAEALELALRFAPQVAFIDIGLPSIDGYEVGRRLRATLDADVILIAMSGYGQDEDRIRSRDAGFDDHFVKPVRPERIDAVLAKVAASLQARSTTATA